MENEYNIQGKISFKVDFDIEANTYEEALSKAKDYINDRYNLDISCSYHDEDSVLIDIDAAEYED